MPEVRAEAISLVDLLLGGTFTVPWHQRRYDWGRNHVQELLEDLNETVTANRSSYFLGTVMLVEKDNKKWEVNDGQQRIITTSLICANLLRIFDQGSDRAGRAIRVLFDRPEMQPSTLDDADDYVPRLTPSGSDRQTYHQMIRGHDIGSDGKLIDAWETIDGFFTVMTPVETDRFFNFIVKGLEVACLYVPESVDANSVFETLNARGKPLSELDKIRNYIYSFFGDNVEPTQRTNVHDNLENIVICWKTAKSEGRVETYVRAFLQTQYGFLPKKNLYRGVKRNIGARVAEPGTSQAARYVRNIVSEMSRGERVQTFKSIVNPSQNSNLFACFSKDSKMSTKSQRKRAAKRNLNEFLNELKHYTVVQSLVFAMLARYVLAQSANRSTVARWAWEQLDILTSFVMRTSYAAAKFEPSKVEKAFAELAQRITASDEPTQVSIINTLRECDYFGIFNETTFKEIVKQRSVRESAKARRFLLVLAHYEQPDLKIVDDKQLYTLEHVLPVSKEHLAGWREFDATSHGECIHMLGNLALLAAKDNKSSDQYNRSFDAKKTILSSSIINLTSSISKNTSWSPDTIECRQEVLASRAAAVWKLPDA